MRRYSHWYEIRMLQWASDNIVNEFNKLDEALKEFYEILDQYGYDDTVVGLIEHWNIDLSFG